MAQTADAKTGQRFRVAAAALAAAPVGFAAGALLGARHPVVAGAGDAAGGMILACGLGGAVVAATVLAVAVARLAPGPARIATLVAGAGSFAILVYLVGNFVNDRLAHARAFNAAYARLPDFEVTLQARDPQRQPLSKLTYQAASRQYVANRPGGWICTGIGNRRQKMAIYEGLRANEQAEANAGIENCTDQWASWTWDDGVGHAGCAEIDQLFAAADAMVAATARGASCRRTAD